MIIKPSEKISHFVDPYSSPCHNWLLWQDKDPTWEPTREQLENSFFRIFYFDKNG